jgi:protein-L-isoaspartate(D-aspartate) O-methyltransferase
MTDFAALRERMVSEQIAGRGLRDGALLDALRSVPREAFVPAGQADRAYGDHALPIEAGQTISQPYIVALMIDAARVQGGDRVLEIGAGSGYAAAVIGQIAAQVIAIERHPQLVMLARERMARLAYENIEVVEGDGSVGWPDAAPYDAILAAATGTHVPQPLIDQLAPRGRLVMPIGDPAGTQQLVQVVKHKDGSIQQSDLGAVRFVPLIGQEAWSHD